MRIFTRTLALVWLIACGGTSSGSATVNGTAGGISLANVSEAVSVVASSVSCGGGNASGALIEISTRPGQCEAAQSNETLASSTTLVLQVLTAGTTPLASGAYTVDGNDVLAVVEELSSSCQSSSAEAASGTIIISAINGGSVSGSFDLQMVARGASSTTELTGTFSAASCSLTTAELCADLTADTETCSP